MLKTLKLSNYRQHVDRTVTFTPGINAVRGAVEAGKSTMIEAWAYLFFGTKALSESLDDVVTYHTPVSKLRVDGEFSFHGVDYTAYRGKSGAEVSWAGGKVTGQTECTRFFESLFRCEAGMAGKLMIAEQVQLRGALEDGPKAAGEMIEYLADFDLLDRVTELVQEKLPCGSTAGVEGRIALLAAQAVEAVVTDLQPLESALMAAQDVLAGRRGELLELEYELEQLDVVQASQILADEKRLTAVVANQKTKIEALEQKLAEPLPEAPAAGAIDALRAKIEAQKGLEAAARVHAGLKSATVDVLWDEPRAALDALVLEDLGKLAALDRAIADRQAAATERRRLRASQEKDLSVKLAQAQARAIKETNCAFCKKDLTDVPEVAAFNADLAGEIATLQKQLTDHLEAATGDEADSKEMMDDDIAARGELAGELVELQLVARSDDQWERILAAAGDNITIDRSVVPARWTWIGPTDEPQDFAGELAKLVEQERTAVAASAVRSGQTVALEDLKNDYAADQAALAALQVKDAQETIDLAAGLKPRIATAREVVEASADAVHLAEGALATAKQANEQGVAAAKSAKQQLALAQAEMEEMGANNVLVKKIRAARPVITNKLWNLTLGSTSKYFSDVRGIPSVVTREDNTFKCNGHPVAGLSGSAKDSLGLAVRVALVKTFMPAMPFMMLDEPAAACNAEREMNMLGLLSTIGFDQVILITHSDLADAFSDNVIFL